MQPDRRFLFISFASADMAVAEWLAEKLSLCGYDPWLDRQRMHAGDNWSHEIGRVMGRETFRVIHLLSRHSLQDSYAAQERTRACDLGRERKEAFLIPLLLEPMARTDLPIEMNSTVSIDFDDWGSGFEGLIALLRKIDAPRHNQARIASPPLHHQLAIVASHSEPLFSNAFAIEGVPAVLHHYRIRSLLTGPQRATLNQSWPHWQPYGTQDALSFYHPPTPLSQAIGLTKDRSVAWTGMNELADQPMSTIIPALLRRTFQQRCRGLGLAHWKLTTPGRTRDRTTDWLYFPRGLVLDDKLSVENWSGKRVRIKLIGERRYKGQPFHAHLAFSPFLEQIEPGAFLLFLQISVRPFQPDGTPFEATEIGPRVKKATRRWTNAELLSRLRVVTQFLSDQDGTIRLGPADQPQIRLRSLNGEIGCALDEELLSQLGAEPASGDQQPDIEESWA